MSTMSNTKSIGDITEAIVLAKLVGCGVTVLQTFGENVRYDLAIDVNGKFYRIQCKTGRLRGGAIEFKNSSVGYKAVQRSYTEEDIDFYGVYCPSTPNSVYLVPVSDGNKYSTYLRVHEPQNNQSKDIKWAYDYEVEEQISKLLQS